MEITSVHELGIMFGGHDIAIKHKYSILECFFRHATGYYLYYNQTLLLKHKFYVM